ncbi:hypothetical protein TSAR_001110 [Trichomalopsis sarcophagae]|uniref:Uncharacterized protein n=1 Tax=Trichomalopsis sarcophagae TaxID=543379 RepID=A0A232FHE5_9HYME|nr:hypothetical protein TSAR_001110 [Trichomalopsis sarcophagae]
MAKSDAICRCIDLTRRYDFAFANVFALSIRIQTHVSERMSETDINCANNSAMLGKNLMLRRTVMLCVIIA